jgi:hypothetical protein
MYASEPNPESYFVNSGSPAVGFNKLINGITRTPQGVPTNEPQIFNLNQDYSVTQNTANNSVVYIGDETFITLNSNLIVPFNDFNPNLTPSVNLQISFPSNISVVYDSVRYHILAGYNLDNIDGLILTIQFPDADGSLVTFSQIRIGKGTSQDYTLNPAPITIGSSIFDKYFQVKIPSMLYMNNQFAAATTSNKPDTLAGKTSKSGRGFLYGAPMRIVGREIVDTTLTNNYPTFGTQIVAQLSLESEDPFGGLGAYVAPSESGEFFEFFPTDNGGFAENFILFQNSIGNSYYVDNKIETLEQLGAALLLTSSFNSIQTTAYDVPNLYRPIVRYSANASSFTIRYTMTLVNSKDQSRIVRIASYTSNNPGQYGTSITPISLQVFPQVQKIYNKVANQVQINAGQDFIPPREIVKYSNVFIERNLVNTTTTNLIVENLTLTESDSGAEQPISYGIGQAFIQITPFDNYFKFTFSKRSPEGSLQLLDLTSSGTFSMVFVDNQNKKVNAPSIENLNIANAAKGELAFKVDETLSTQILQFTNRRFYISNRPLETATDNTFGISRFSNASQRLAARSFSLNDTIKDKVLSSDRERNQTAGFVSDTTLGVTRNIVSSNASSVLYWGNWVKEGENIPRRTAVNPRVYQSRPGIAARLLSQNQAVGKSSWQAFGGATNADSSSLPSPTTTTQPGGFLNRIRRGAELRIAISSDVQGKIALGWQTIEIIEYFLNPSAIGFKLYSGITKQIFTQAVTGIFSNDQLVILNNYGNTSGGLTNGGPASTRGVTTTQSGSSSVVPPVQPPRPSGNEGGRPKN